MCAGSGNLLSVGILGMVAVLLSCRVNGKVKVSLKYLVRLSKSEIYRMREVAD